MTGQSDDLVLINGIARRDEAALGALYDRYHRLVFSVALSVVGRQEDAEEITLDVFTRVWSNAHRYRPDRAQVQTWLARLARNRAIDVLRRESVRPMRYSLSWNELWPHPATEGDSPEAAAHHAGERRRVRQAVTTLSDSQQEVLALAYFKGYSHREIATELGLALGTVKGRIRSAMRTLRAELQDE